MPQLTAYRKKPRTVLADFCVENIELGGQSSKSYWAEYQRGEGYIEGNSGDLQRVPLEYSTYELAHAHEERNTREV